MDFYSKERERKRNIRISEQQGIVTAVMFETSMIVRKIIPLSMIEFDDFECCLTVRTFVLLFGPFTMKK